MIIRLQFDLNASPKANDSFFINPELFKYWPAVGLLYPNPGNVKTQITSKKGELQNVYILNISLLLFISLLKEDSVNNAEVVGQTILQSDPIEAELEWRSLMHFLQVNVSLPISLD